MKRFTLLLFIFTFFLISMAAQDVDLILLNDSFDEPVDIASAGDERLFIVEKRGVIKIMNKDGAIVENNFLDIRSRIANSGGERGLLGMVFHPDFNTNGYFYINYTDDRNDTQVSRFRVNPDNPNQADSNSEFFIINIDQPRGNHNAGDLSFGPDGYLYLGMGDGGGANDPDNFSQTNSSLLGKMLRLDVDNTDGEGYGIPSDNPFIDDSAVADEIWSTGLRNPWRYSFDRETGDLWMADVGQNRFEEVHKQPADSEGGENYGWRCYEGDAEFNSSGCSADANDFVFPVHAYNHALGCSVTGGYVYRGTQYPSLTGKYIFGDFCSGRMWTLTETNTGEWERAEIFDGPSSSWSTFGEDNTGEVYVASLAGEIYKITTNEIVSTDVENQSGNFFVLKNPFGDKLEVKIKASNFINGRLSLSNLNGQEVYSQFIENLDNLSVVIPTSTLPQGFYYIVLEAEGEQLVKKVLRQ